MALCTRCGRQTELDAEFCSGCGSYLGSRERDRSHAVAAGSGSTGYLRPFAARVPGGTALRDSDERAAWAEPDSGPQQWSGSSSETSSDLPQRLADYAGNARYGTGDFRTGDPLTDDRPDPAGPSAGGFALVPRGPFEPARPYYPQDEQPDQQADDYQSGPVRGPDSPPAGYRVPDSPPAGYPIADTPPAGYHAPGYPLPDTPPAGYPATDSPAAGYPVPDSPAAGFPLPDTPAAGYPVTDSPAAGFPETGGQEPGGLLGFGPDDDPLTSRVPPEYPAGSGQYAPGPVISPERAADAPYDPLAPYDLLADRPTGYAGPEEPAAAAGHPFPHPDADDWPAEEATRSGFRNSRWISIAAAAVVLIICAATAAILMSHGKPAAKPGRSGGQHRPTATAAPAPTVKGAITIMPAAASGPDSPAVVTFLARYFSAINHHNFGAYRQLFSAPLRGGLSQTTFLAGYGSTRDSQATLHAITASASGELTAAVTFMSHQQPAASPNQSSCNTWTVSLYLRQEGGRIVLVSPPAGYQATFRNC